MAWLCFEDITRKKYGLLKTKRRDAWFRIFVLILNIIATPILLVVHSISIYLMPCISSSIVGCCFRVIFSKIFMCCTQSLLFEDKEFPPNHKSLGNVKSSQRVVWKRSSEIPWKKIDVKVTENGKEKIKTKTFCYDRLVEGGMDPEDICQGALGNCWLLSALASLSATSTTLEECFITREWNPRGKYVVRLWDEDSKKYVNVNVDDFFPVAESSGMHTHTSLIHQSHSQ